MSQSTTLEPCRTAGTGILTTLGGAMKRLRSAHSAWRAQTAAMASLHRMSDRDLSDIGLTRGEIDSAVRGKPARTRAHVPEF